MPEKGDYVKKTSSPRDNLTLFGDWFYFVIDYLNVTIDDIAEQTGYKEGSLSKATRHSTTTRTTRPSRAMVKKILSAFHTIASKKEMMWGRPLDMRIMHAAGYATDEDIQASKESLDIMRSHH
jgi:hypothetical protein